MFAAVSANSSFNETKLYHATEPHAVLFVFIARVQSRNFNDLPPLAKHTGRLHGDRRSMLTRDQVELDPFSATASKFSQARISDLGVRIANLIKPSN